MFSHAYRPTIARTVRDALAFVLPSALLLCPLLAKRALAAPQAGATAQDALGHNVAVDQQPVPRLIMLSGAVKDMAGKPLEGPTDLSFAIYKDQSAAEPLWQETQTLNLDEQGRYTVLLGATQPEGLPLDLFTSGEARWLGVTASGLPEQPRILLVSVPYALKAVDAETFGGKPPSSYVLAQPAQGSAEAGPRSTSSTASGAANSRSQPAKGVLIPLTVGSGSSGTQNYVAKWVDTSNDLGNSLIYDNGTNVGIGTTAPTALLQVENPNSSGGFQNNTRGIVDITGNGGPPLPQFQTLSFTDSYNQVLGKIATYKTSSGSYLYFGTSNSYGSGVTNNGLVMDYNGNVGIGTTAPGAALEVNGAAKFDSGVTFPTGTINPVSLASGTAGISITGSAASATTAATATNALSLGGVVAANYARLDIGNSFAGNQSVTGNVSATGSVSGGTASFTGALTGTTATFGGALAAAGAALPAMGTATSSQGYNSNPMDLLASSFNSGTSAAVSQLFRWRAEPAGNNTTSPSGTLNLLYLSGTGTPAETGLSIASNGRLTFASGQTFPGTGTITGVTAGTDLTGGGTTGTVTLNLDTTKVPTLAATSNTFTGSVAATSFAGSGAGLTNLTAANISAGTAGINISGSAATATTATNALSLGGVAASNYARLDIGNSFNGNQNMTGNVNATGSFSAASAGIGTTAPTAGLEVQNTGSSSAFQNNVKGIVDITGNQGSNPGQFQALTFSDTNAAVLGKVATYKTGVGSYLYFGTSNSYGSGVTNNGLVMDYSGNVGIGTTTPSATLQVQNTSQSTVFQGPAKGIVDILGDGNNLPQFQALTFSENNGETLGKIATYKTNQGSYMYLGTSNNWSSGITNNGLVMDYNGNVGIGTTAPGAALEVNGPAKFDSSVTFPSGTINPVSLSSGTAGISITGNANNALSLGGVPAGNYARLDIANTFAANQSMSGNLFVGSGTASGLPLEIRAGGSSSQNDALTVDSQGNVVAGVGAGAHITTGSANSDFAGGGSAISIPANATAASPPLTFALPFAYVPACVVTPYVVPGAAAPTAIPSWYITYQTNSQGQYASFTVNLVSANPNSNPITFNYVCVGNPN
jgi:hypothetical protein